MALILKIWITDLAFSPDGQFLASTGQDLQVRLWDLQSGDCVQTLTGLTRPSYGSDGVQFSADGQWLVNGCFDGVIRVWQRNPDPLSREMLFLRECRILEGHASEVTAIALAPLYRELSNNTPLLASGGADRTIKFWNIRTGQCLNTLEAHDDWVYSLAFSPDGSRLVSGSYDYTAKLWDVSTGECLQCFGDRSNRVWNVAFSPDGAKLAIADDRIEL